MVHLQGLGPCQAGFVHAQLSLLGALVSLGLAVTMTPPMARWLFKICFVFHCCLTAVGFYVGST